MTELIACPLGRHDDQADSTSQFLIWAAKQRPLGQISIGIVSITKDDLPSEVYRPPRLDRW
jgi:hypothetical protein